MEKYIVFSYINGNPIAATKGYKEAAKRANVVNPPYSFCKVSEYFSAMHLDEYQKRKAGAMLSNLTK